MLAFYFGKYILRWAGTAAQGTPLIAQGSGEVQLSGSTAMESLTVVLPTETRLMSSVTFPAPKQELA
ncbi:MAG: hypothetical protein PVS2B2_00410 [Candidatus Acidiferrum sp.]